MAQYKASMERLFRTDGESPPQPMIATKHITTSYSAVATSPIEVFVDQHFNFLMRYAIPLVWVLLFVTYMDRESFVKDFYITCIGVFAAVLCNAVPIGGGVVYVPALAMLGVNLHLGVSFSVATMTFGNGVFGFLKWMHKEPTLVIWESFLYTVFPSSVGSFIAMMFFPPLEVSVIRSIFAWFCLCLASLVCFAVYRGGAIDKIVECAPLSTSAFACMAPRSVERSSVEQQLEENSHSPESEGDVEGEGRGNDNAELIVENANSNSSPLSQQRSSICSVEATQKQWLWLGIVSFLAGALLVPNIGVGPALTTFLGLQLVGYPAKSAIVTGIITGGWVSLVPFLIHLWRQNVPMQLWVMVLPGVYVGSQVSSFFPLTIYFFVLN